MPTESILSVALESPKVKRGGDFNAFRRFSKLAINYPIKFGMSLEGTQVCLRGNSVT